MDTVIEDTLHCFDWFDCLAAAIGASFGYFFGGVDGFIHALIAFTILDYITGLFAAGVQHRLSSNIGFKGIAKKVTIFVLVGVAHIIDHELLGDTKFLRDAVLFFYLANEGLSIMENAINIGIPVPEVMKEKLLQFREDSKNKNKDTKLKGKVKDN